MAHGPVHDFATARRVALTTALPPPAQTARRTRPPVLYWPGPAADCGPFSVAGSYGDADYNPMVHASTFDVASRTLFVLVSPAEHQLAIAIIELGKGTMRRVDVEAGADEVLDGFNYDPSTNTLFGVAQAKPQGLTMRRLDVGSGKWSSTAIKSQYAYIGGNDGTVRCYDRGSGTLYVLVCNPPTDPNADPIYHLAAVDVAANAVAAAPAIRLVTGPPTVKELFVMQLALAQ